MQEVHSDVIRARHEVIAHYDAKARKMWIVPPGAASDDVVPASAAGIVLKFETYHISGGSFDSLGQVCNYQIGRINKAIDEQLAVLYDDQDLPGEAFLLTLDDAL
ncbi:hypothetical protein JAK45_19460 [Stenotrophomonas maltophilia]|nr:hypothetical protein [Stenotrophomonas maltophilia]